MDQNQIKDRIKDGCYITNQFLLGGLTGWLTAVFIKKFGRVALSAAGGGLLLLVLSAKKGYVNVNYDSIYQELSRLCEEEGELEPDVETYEDAKATELSTASNQDKLIIGATNADSSLRKSKSSPSEGWGIDKMKSATKWIATHSYSVGGFAITFIYNII